MARSLKTKSRSVSAKEWGIKNYLNKHGIHANDSNMQTIIINSYISHCDLSNELLWKDKLEHVQNNFGKFCMYAHNHWKDDTKRMEG